MTDVQDVHIEGVQRAVVEVKYLSFECRLYRVDFLVHSVILTFFTKKYPSK